MELFTEEPKSSYIVINIWKTGRIDLCSVDENNVLWGTLEKSNYAITLYVSKAKANKSIAATKQYVIDNNLSWDTNYKIIECAPFQLGISTIKPEKLRQTHEEEIEEEMVLTLENQADKVG